jgi:hypothetical protein
MLAVAALGLGLGSDWRRPAQPDVARQQAVEPPVVVRAPDTPDEPPRDILSAGARWQTLLAKAETGTANAQTGAIPPPTASIWSVGSAARLDGLND